MIILEGPDGSGKSTLAQELVKLGYGYRHEGPPPKNVDLFRHYQAVIHDMGDLRVVCDRLFLGEPVYGPLLRGRSLLSQGQVAYLQLEAAVRGVTTVLCTAEPEVLEIRGDPIYRRPDGAVTGRVLLDRYVAQAPMIWPLADWKSDGTTPVAFKAAMLDLQHAPRTWNHRGVGNPYAPALVGDRFSRGPYPVPGHPDWEREPLKAYRPFDRARSGEYLLQALLQVGLSAADFYLTNSLKEDVNLGTSIHQLRQELSHCPRIVALGRAAADRLRQARLSVDVEVPHPQYWSRFRHEDVVGYGKILREALEP